MRVGLALISAGLLAACGQGGSGGAAFPDLSGGQYRAEATISHEDGASMPVVMIRDGARMRMEFSDPAQGQMAIVSNAATGDSFILMTRDGRTMAIQGGQMPGGQQFENPAADWNAEAESTATRTGSCSVAGQNGSEWTQTEEDVAKVACVTDDGILLRATEGDTTVWETTNVARGPQDAALFALPPGVEMMDVGAMMGAMTGAGSGPDARQGAGQAGGVCQMMRNAGAPADALARAGC